MNHKPGTVCTIQPGKGHLRVHGWALLQGLVASSVTPFSDWMMRCHMEPQTQLTIKGCVMFATKRHTHTHVYYLHIFRYIGSLASIQISGWSLSLWTAVRIRFFECFGYGCVCIFICPDVCFDFCLFQYMTLYPFPLDIYCNMLLQLL